MGQSTKNMTSVRRALVIFLSLIMTATFLGMTASPSYAAKKKNGSNGNPGVVLNLSKNVSGTGAPATTVARRTTNPPAATNVPVQDLFVNFAVGCAGGSTTANECIIVSDSGVYAFSTGSRSPDPNYMSLAGKCLGSRVVGYDNGNPISDNFSGIAWSYTGVMVIHRHQVQDPIMGDIYDGPGPNGVRDTDPVTHLPGGTDDQYHYGQIGLGAPYWVEDSRSYATASTNTRCLLPALFREQVYVCPYQVDLSIDGPHDNPITPSSVTNSAPYTPWGESWNAGQSINVDGRPIGSGPKVGNLALCADKTALIDDDPNVWGRWHEHGIGHFRECRVWDYYQADQATGALPAPVSRQPCDLIPEIEEADYYFTKFCKSENEPMVRYEDGPTGWDYAATGSLKFTSDDCSPIRFTPDRRVDWNAWCPRPTTPTLNGLVAADYEVLADGDPNTSRWVVPKPTDPAVRSMTNPRSKFVVEKMSSPWRGETPTQPGSNGTVGVNDANQFFDGSVDFDAWHLGQMPTIDLKWFKAGFTDDAGNANQWSLYPQWTWDAVLRATVQTGQKWDWGTGTSTSRRTTTFDFPARLQCNGDPLDVYAKRSRLTTTP